MAVMAYVSCAIWRYPIVTHMVRSFCLYYLISFIDWRKRRVRGLRK